MTDSIPICRSVFEHWIYQDAEFLKVWITMLGRARYLDKPKQGIYQGIVYTLNRGEFIFGRKTWSDSCGISEERLKRLITLLIKDGMLIKTNFTGKFTIYLIANYDKFNQPKNVKTQGFLSDEHPAEPLTETPTETQQTPQQTPTNKEGIKKVKKVNTASPSFNLFWDLYPKKEAKQDCIKLWSKIPESKHKIIMDAVRRYKTSEKVIGGYIMSPDRWLRGSRWEDEYDEIQTKTQDIIL